MFVMAVKVLIIEDDPLIIEFLKLGLGKEGFEILVDSQGTEAVELFRKNQPTLIILDLLLPGGLQGEELCKRLRAETDVPILVLSCRDDVKDKVLLFTLGADDYVLKPFSFDELLARIRALLRRYGPIAGVEEIHFNGIILKLDTREVFRRGTFIKLTAKEFDLLHLFLQNPRRVLTKGLILEKIWGYDYVSDSNTVEVYVGHLRRKLGEPQIIQTMRGAGYCLRIQE